MRTVSLDVKKNESLLDAARRSGCELASFCGGNGRCGKCLVKISGEAANREEYRLACSFYPGERTVTFEYEEQKNIAAGTVTLNDVQNLNEDLFAAVDIGTTTIEISYLTANGEKIAKKHIMNPQVSFGSDVITRIESAERGNLEEMKSRVREVLQKSTEIFSVESKQDLTSQNKKNKLVKITHAKEYVIAGNTTMIHLLMGYPLSGMKTYPFRPHSLKSGKGTAGVPFVTFPAISAFIGGDITSGLYACGFFESDKLQLFIDLGTNAEMAIGNKDRILAASASAGPCFEGAEISCGMPAFPGAICGAYSANGRIYVKTVPEPANNAGRDGDSPAESKVTAPEGICGTGLIELVYELLSQDIINEDGTFTDDEYIKNGFTAALKRDGTPILLTQKDIRAFQLAKAAIATGISMLAEAYGCNAEEIDRVFVTGGFSGGLDIKKAAGTGMIPASLADKTVIVDNASLKGAEKIILFSKENKTTNDLNENIISLEKAVKKCETLELAATAGFNEKLLGNMSIRKNFAINKQEKG